MSLLVVRKVLLLIWNVLFLYTFVCRTRYQIYIINITKIFTTTVYKLKKSIRNGHKCKEKIFSQVLVKRELYYGDV